MRQLSRLNLFLPVRFPYSDLLAAIFLFFRKSIFRSPCPPVTIVRKDTLLFRCSQSLMTAPCRHQQVRFVSREEDAEFVECMNCGEVFDAAELRDIAAEEEDAEDSGLAEDSGRNPGKNQAKKLDR